MKKIDWQIVATERNVQSEQKGWFTIRKKD